MVMVSIATALPESVTEEVGRVIDWSVLAETEGEVEEEGWEVEKRRSETSTVLW